MEARSFISAQRLPSCAALLLICLLAASCNRQGSEGAARRGAETPVAAPEALPRYVVSVVPLELILREVCGKRAAVTTLLKPGTNSHTYDPTPGDARLVQAATGFFWIGKEFDDWAADFSTPHGTAVLDLIPAADLLELAPHAEWGGDEADHEHGAGEHDHQHGHAHGAPHAAEEAVPDPHFACDPLAVQALLPGLATRLGELDPGGADQYQANALRFAAQLELLHAELTTELAPVKGRPVILFHPSFNYFLKRYGLVYAGVIEPFPGKEPSPKYLQGIVSQVEQSHAKALFTETLLPTAPADVIAEAARVPVVELDPGCGNSGRAYADYAEWVRYNAGLFLNALR